MSMDREFETSKGGITRQFVIAASAATVIRLCDFTSSSKRKRSFAVRITTAAGVRVRQGGKDVSVSVTAADADFGMLLTSGFRWRYDVDNDTEAYLAFRNPSAAAGVTVEITRISDVQTDDAPAAV